MVMTGTKGRYSKDIRFGTGFIEWPSLTEDSCFVAVHQTTFSAGAEDVYGCVAGQSYGNRGVDFVFLSTPVEDVRTIVNRFPPAYWLKGAVWKAYAPADLGEMLSQADMCMVYSTVANARRFYNQLSTRASFMIPGVLNSLGLIQDFVRIGDVRYVAAVGVDAIIQEDITGTVGYHIHLLDQMMPTVRD